MHLICFYFLTTYTYVHKQSLSLFGGIFKVCLQGNTARRQWLAPEILPTQEAEIKRIAVQSQPEQIV
jgi:hypothetical protein